MQNQEIIKIIENLKGRKNYEEKKASKLGFPSLYAYFEDKILKEKKDIEEKKKEFEEIQDQKELPNKEKSNKSCSCCWQLWFNLKIFLFKIYWLNCFMRGIVLSLAELIKMVWDMKMLLKLEL